MKHNRFLQRMTAMLLVMALVLSLSACNNQGTTKTANIQTQSSVTYSDKLFDASYVHTVDISISDADWSDLLANATDKTKYNVDITIDGETISSVSFSTKGNTSLTSVASDEDNDRYSFKVNFGKYVEGQTYYGLDKLNLNNLYADATYMKDYLSYEIFRQAGVDAPLISYVWLTVNGEDFGLYLAIEDVDSSWLERTNDGEGCLYKPETERLGNMTQKGGAPHTNGEQHTPPARPDSADTSKEESRTPPSFDADSSGRPDGGLSQSGKDHPQPGAIGESSKGADLAYSDDELTSYSDIFDNSETDSSEADQARVVAALKSLSNGENLEEVLDTDEIIRYFAAHNFVLNYDSYTGTMLHNYYLLERDGKLSMLPWDYNLAFGGFSHGGYNGEESSTTSLINTGIDTPLSGTTEDARPMWSWIAASAEYTEAYHQVYEELLTNYFESGEFEAQMDALYEMLLPYVEKDPTAFYSAEEFTTAYETLKEFCLLRAQSIRAQLDGSLSTRTEEQSAEAQIDASGLELKTMGSQGGGKDQKGGSAPPDMEGNRETESSGA